MEPIKIGVFARLSDGIDSFNLSTRLPEEGDNELSRLAKAINKMLDRLSSAHLEQNHVLYEVLEQAQEQAHDLQQVRKQLADGSPQAVMLDGSLVKMQSLSQNLALLLESGREGFLHDQETRLDSFVEKLAGQLRKQYPEHTCRCQRVYGYQAYFHRHAPFGAQCGGA